MWQIKWGRNSLLATPNRTYLFGIIGEFRPTGFHPYESTSKLQRLPSGWTVTLTGKTLNTVEAELLEFRPNEVRKLGGS